MNGLPGSRLLLFATLFAGLSLAGVAVVYFGVAERSISWDARLLDADLLSGCAALLAIYFTADGLRLYFTLRALGSRVPLRWMARLVFINLFFSNVTPLATGGGVAQIWYLQRRGIPVGTATAATTVRTLLAAGLIFLGTATLPLILPIFDGTLVDGPLASLLITFAAGYLGFFALAVKRTRWLLYPLDGGLALLERLRIITPQRHWRWGWWIRRELCHFRLGIGAYLHGHPLDIAMSLLCTAIFLLALFSFPALLLHGLGYEVAYGHILALLVVTTFIMYISPTPGSSGVAEGAFGHFLTGITHPEHLVLVTVGWRVLTIYVGMAIGAVLTMQEVWKLRGKVRGADETDGVTRR